MSSWMTKLFAIDLRSLALFRISLGLYLIWDILNFFQDLEAFFTNKGVLPLATRLSNLEGPVFSAHFFSGSYEWQLFLHCLTLLFAVSFTLGFRTRVSNFAIWVLYLSLYNRNPLIDQGGDVLSKLLLFWSLFLPLGAKFSLDARSSKTSFEHQQVFSLASFALLIQVAFMYFFTAILKSDKEWFEEASAVYYALHIDQYTKPFGIYLRENLPFEFLQFLTHSTLLLELLGPLLLFSPIFFVPIRLIGLCCFALLHIGIQLCLAVGVFSFVSVIALIPFIPAWIWDRSGNINTLRSSHKTSLLTAFFLCYVLALNIETTISTQIIPNQLRWISSTLQLNPNWGMFAPRPLLYDGWDVIVGQLENGELTDLFHDFDKLEKKAVVAWDKPEYVYRSFKRQRWRHIFMFIRRHPNQVYRQAMLNYLCHGWNNKHEHSEILSTVKWYYMLEEAELGNRIKPIRKILVAEKNCQITP